MLVESWELFVVMVCPDSTLVLVEDSFVPRANACG